MKFKKSLEKWKRSYRKRFSKRNPAYYYKKKLIDKKDPIIFDIGAHTGNTVIEYLKDFPEACLYCFEPYSESFNILKERFSKNKKVQCHKFALSNKKESRILNCNKSSDTNSLLQFSDEANQLWESNDLFSNYGQNEVECYSLDLFCEENQIENIDILKLDCQGFEKYILEGSKVMLEFQKINLIFTEVSFREIYNGQTQFHEVCSYLEKYNFQLFNLYDCVIKSAQMIQSDALFINKSFSSRSTVIGSLI